jgi:alpha-galactosidase
LSLFGDGMTITWGHSALRLTVDVTPGRPVSVRELTDGRAAEVPVRPEQPLVEILTAGTGRAAVSQRFAETTIGRRLVFTGQESSRAGAWRRLRIALRDEPTGLLVEVTFRTRDGVSAVRSEVRVTNDGTGRVLLLGVSSFAAGFLGRPVERLDVVHGSGEWLGEGRWRRRPFREIAADLGLPLHRQHGRGRFAAISTGGWSTSGDLPTGGLVDRESGDAWLWQVEHNGAWRWETGERLDGAYVTLLGPTDLDHQWRQELEPGASFTTVPVSVAVSGDGLHGAAAALTAHRRAIVGPHADRTALSVVFNDYMNALMGDPSTAKLLPLIDAAAGVGAEVFCIDAGWYGDGAWWDSVGAWEPSQHRFPRGIEEVLAHIRRRGLLPGLWLEPEVVGVRSPIAGKLPDEAFLQRGGARVVEHDRYHLDLRHPLAVAHLNETIDRLVDELGVGYLKLDYNIDPGVGTDRDADSAGAGLLAHNRAHLAWLDQVLDRHPGLILENCASGAMRMDYALLARMHLQSTSDQQDFRRYPPIAAAAPMSLLPEQAGIWAYPQPDMSEEEIAFTLCTALLGRLYLSGRIDQMTEHQLTSVRDAVAVYRGLRADLVSATPLWPLGLPGWSDPWLSLALRSGDTTYLTVWHRGGTTGDAVLSLPHLAGAVVEVDTLYPRHLPPFVHRFDPGTGRLTIARRDPETVCARLFRIRAIRKDSR